MMDKTRTKYANNPELRPRLPFKPTLAPTPEELERNERTDARIAESAHRIAKGKAQLSAPITLQSKVKAAEEHDEMRANRKWDQGYRAADELTDKMLANNQVLFESIMGSIDDVDANCVPLPDVTDLPELPPSPKLEWLSGVPNDVRDWVKQSNEQWEEYPRGEVKLCTIDATRTSTRTEFGEYRTGSEVSAGTLLRRVLNVMKKN